MSSKTSRSNTQKNPPLDPDGRQIYEAAEFLWPCRIFEIDTETDDYEWYMVYLKELCGDPCAEGEYYRLVLASMPTHWHEEQAVYDIYLQLLGMVEAKRAAALGVVGRTVKAA